MVGFRQFKEGYGVVKTLLQAGFSGTAGYGRDVGRSYGLPFGYPARHDDDRYRSSRLVKSGNGKGVK